MNTRRFFGRALKELLASRSIDEITVHEIVVHSGLSKSSFYNHFTDKYDLVTWMHLEDVCSLPFKMLEEEKSYREILDVLLQAHKDNRLLSVNALRSRDYNSLKGYLYKLTLDFNLRYYELHGADLDDWETRELIAIQSKGCTACVIRWIKRECDTPVERIADIIFRSAPAELRACLR
ncbi:MAG: TetR/AcrR family transcriptional regulator [Coriobacteriales bacterium]|jgi:AcrR family transcriptional regulator|nr:TetR/AcrR family transcriptional regulator [Coriobacteriales bacterium]